MRKRLIIAIILIMLGSGAILTSLAIIGPPLETPWDDPNCWYSNSKNSPQFELIYDYDLDKDVMRLYGNYISYYFMLKNAEVGPMVADKKYMRILSLDLKSEGGERFQIFVNLKTTRGNTILWYEALAIDYGRYLYSYCRYGLPDNIRDGHWHTIYRDIRKDFKTVFPMDEILEVTSIRFNGDLSIANVRFHAELPWDVKITKPDVYKYIYHFVFNEETKRKIWQKMDSFDEYGNLMQYSIYNLYYWPNGRYKKRQYCTYNPDKSLKFAGMSEYSKDETKSKSWGFDTEMKTKHCGITQWTGSVLDYIGITFDRNGEVYYIFERENDEYRGWKAGTRWFNYYKFRVQDGLAIRERIKNTDLEDPDFDYNTFKENLFKDFDEDTLKKVFEEFNFEEGECTNSVHTAYDASGHIISKATRYHDPELAGIWGDWGVWFEKEHYNEQGKTTKITRGRNFYGGRLTGGLYSGIECDYDINNNTEQMRMIYYGYANEKDLKNRWTFYYDNEAKLIKLKTDEFDSYNLSSSNVVAVPELGHEKITDTWIIFPDSPVMDGNMQSIEGLKPVWKPEGKPICKKTSEGMKIERPHEEEEAEPGYAVQFILINEGEHQLAVNYNRKVGEAHIRVDWVSIEDLYTTEKLDELATNIDEFTDDSSLGPQEKRFIFTTDKPGLLILKIGAASVVIYSNIELRPYAPEPPTEPTPEPEPGPEPEPEPIIHPEEPPVLPSEEPEEKSPEIKYIIQDKEEDLGESYTLVASDTRQDSEGNTQVIYQEVYKEVPVYGGYISVQTDKSENIKTIKDKTVKIKAPHERTLETIRTTRGEAIYKVIKEEIDVPEKELERIIPKYDAEMVIASTQESGNPKLTSYGWHVKGPEVDRVISTETGKDLYKIKRSTIAPPTKLPKKEVEKPKFIHKIRRLYSKFQEWLTNLFRVVKR